MKKYYCVVITIGFLTSCIDSNSSKLDSDDYDNKEERIKKLKMEIKSFSDFQDAEFELFNVNGFHNKRTSVPGSSSFDYKFVIKLDTVNIPKWTTGMTEVKLTDYDDGWTEEMIKGRKENWQTLSKPQYFKRNDENVMLLVYKNEGIIYKRVTNL